MDTPTTARRRGVDVDDSFFINNRRRSWAYVTGYRRREAAREAKEAEIEAQRSGEAEHLNALTELRAVQREIRQLQYARYVSRDMYAELCAAARSPLPEDLQAINVWVTVGRDLVARAQEDIQRGRAKEQQREAEAERYWEEYDRSVEEELYARMREDAQRAEEDAYWAAAEHWLFFAENRKVLRREARERSEAWLYRYRSKYDRNGTDRDPRRAWRRHHRSLHRPW